MKKLLRKVIGWIVVLSSTGAAFNVIAISSLVVSCSVQQSLPKAKLGSVDLSIKGDITENLSTLKSHQIEQEVGRGSALSRSLKWQHLDLGLDHIFGISSDRFYSEINLEQNKTIIVAVIDSGVDIEHEDLKNKLWKNKKEIANNGIDDDLNGYVDDIHGWNFLGHKSGENLALASLEETRVYKRLLAKKISGETFSVIEEKNFMMSSKAVLDGLQKHLPLYREALKDKKTFDEHEKLLKEKFGIKGIQFFADIVAIPETSDKLIKVKDELIAIWDKYFKGIKGLTRTLEKSGYYVNVGYNINYDGRSKIVKDNPSDFTDRNYGNNDVKGPNARHGTHVAGLIAAQRNNTLGIDGVATNVEIMALRAIPEGDERDKDIAMAIRYAADNGAHIINMSFSKNLSPYKGQVDAAMMYAASKGVIFFSSAGNTASNNDGGETKFPNSYKRVGAGVLMVNTIPHWIEVGATSLFPGQELVANFSNYGKESVTLFAPGYKIYSTTPGDNYKALSGTSMATPIAAGVAAVLMSEFENLSGKEILDVLKKSVIKTQELEVQTPGSEEGEEIKFSDLSATGGIINLYDAFKLATEVNEAPK